MNEVTPFNFEGSTVRWIMIDGQPWFVAADVCAALDYSNPTDATNRLESDDLAFSEVIDSMGRRQRSRVISEAGVYELIFRSNKPEARRFRRWITSEVLPSLRRTGQYVIEPQPADDLDLMVQSIEKIRQLRAEHEETQRRTTMLELGQAILHDGMKGLAAKISAVAGEYDEFTTLAYAKLNGLPTDRISCQRHGQRATAEMKRRGGAPRKVQDATFGMINVYPLNILHETAEPFNS